MGLVLAAIILIANILAFHTKFIRKNWNFFMRTRNCPKQTFFVYVRDYFFLPNGGTIRPMYTI